MKTDYFCLLDNTIDVEADFNLKFDVEADLNITINEMKRIVKVPPQHILTSIDKKIYEVRHEFEQNSYAEISESFPARTGPSVKFDPQFIDVNFDELRIKKNQTQLRRLLAM